VDLDPHRREGFLRASFSVFRVKVCRGGAQVVLVAPRAIRSPRLQPHLGSNIKRLVECCGLRGFRLAVMIFRSSRSFIVSSSFFFVFGTNVVFFVHSATSRPQPTTSSRLREERQRAIYTVYRLKMKSFSKILL
jgi:hypothetical protein